MSKSMPILESILIRQKKRSTLNISALQLKNVPYQYIETKGVK